LCGESRENAHDAVSGKREVDFDGDRLAREVVNDRQRAELAPGAEQVVHEIERPALVRARNRGNHVAPDVPHAAFATWPQFEAMCAIDPMYALVVDQKAWSSRGSSMRR
jgi:hypothetical protein